MLSEIQFMNIKNIYILFTNISDSANIWIQELHINDTIETHKEKLTIIMNLITNMNEMIDGDLDDILLIVEENLKEYIFKWLEVYKKEIVIAGLDGDSKRNPIGQILDLIPYCDSCIKIKSLCKRCNDGTPGIFSLRTNDNQEQVQIGGAESYMPVCRKHYNFV